MNLSLLTDFEQATKPFCRSEIRNWKRSSVRNGGYQGIEIENASRILNS